MGAGVVLGTGLGGFLDGILFHQILQWHHMATSAGYPDGNVANLRLNVFLDGMFHVMTYVLVCAGLLMLWQMQKRYGQVLSGRRLFGAVLMGFGLFNLLEGSVDHVLLGIHHVNETVPRDQWVWWDAAFLVWGAVMLVVGRALLQKGAGDPARFTP